MFETVTEQTYLKRQAVNSPPESKTMGENKVLKIGVESP